MESNLAGAPQMDIITSRKERQGEHVGSAYIDVANQAKMAQYNNEYNYWLWLQQAKYNSPEQQRARLEAAGLNPNFNSVDSGNLGAIPSSSGSVTPSVGKNSAAMMQNNINTFNALVKSIGEGISDVSKISGIPDDISTYRKLLTQLMGHNVQSAEYGKILKAVDAVWRSKSELGVDIPLLIPGYGENGDPWMHSANWKESPLYQALGLKNTNLSLSNDDLRWLVKLRQYDFENMKPQELKVLEARAKQIGASAGLTEAQNQLFAAMSATKIGAMLGPILLGFIKLFL